jgi:hypothetical protein
LKQKRGTFLVEKLRSKIVRKWVFLQRQRGAEGRGAQNVEEKTTPFTASLSSAGLGKQVIVIPRSMSYPTE